MTANKQDIDSIARRVAALEHKLTLLIANGMRGEGVCICKLSPAAATRAAERMGSTLASGGTNMLLDHRCPAHGENAQPNLWGRNRTLELLVEPHQWLSLGVTYDNPPAPSVSNEVP